MSAPKLERLLNLVAALLASRTPLTIEQIRDRVHGYPESTEAFRRSFERDKDELRSIGVPLRLVGDGALAAYSIDADDYELRDFGLNDAERSALRLASGMVRVGSLDADAGIAQLGGAPQPADAGADVIAAGIAAPEALVACFEGVASQRVIEFVYHQTPRSIHPARLQYLNGRWYLDGFDEGRDDRRVFRVDRIESAVTLGGPATRSPSDDASIAKPWVAPREDTESVRLWVASDFVESVARSLPACEVTVNDDGTAIISTDVSRWPFFKRFVLGYLDHVVVLAPQRFVSDMTSWLRACAEEPRFEVADIRPPKVSAHFGDHTTIGGTERQGTRASAKTSRKPRETAGERLTRILAIVPWIAEHPGTDITTVCERFGIERTELLADLEIVFMVGIYPYTPDTMVDVLIEDGKIWVRLGSFFTKPMRLSHGQALALLIAGTTAMALPGADPTGALSSAVQKLSSQITGVGAQPIEVSFGDVDTSILDTLRRAAADGGAVSIDYYTFGRDQFSTRVIEPTAVYADDGHWYVDGWCHSVNAPRTFRVDRVRSAAMADGPPISGPALSVTAIRPTSRQDERLLPRIQLVIDADETWVADVHKADSVERVGDDRIMLTMPVSGAAWLARLLLLIGPKLEIRGPAHVIYAGRDAALTALDAYDVRAAPSNVGTT